MDAGSEEESPRRRLRCEAEPAGYLAGSRCPFCGGVLAGRAGRHPALEGLLWAVGAYRAWSLGMFAFAVFHLVRVGDFLSYYLFFLVVAPFSTALVLSYRYRGVRSRWLVAYLLLIDLGVIIGPEHRLLPILHRFPTLPETQSRILTWYLLIFFSLQFVTAPPVAFGRSLLTAWRGGKPALAGWICWFGLAAWALIVFLLVVGAFENRG